MNLFKKNEDKNTENKKVKSAFLLKYGGFSTAMIAIVLAAVIILNLLMSVLNDSGLLKFDATSASKYSISAENEAFIKKIDKKVTLTVLSAKAEYGNLANFAYQYLGVSDEDNYCDQTVKLLERYAELNDNIELKFIDFYGTQSKTILQKNPTAFYGDILVSYTDEKGGENSRLVTFDDIYSYEAMYSQYATITENKLETALSSAINTLLYRKIKNLSVLSAHSDPNFAEVLEEYTQSLSLNGFNVTENEDAILTKIDENIDVLLIAAPKNDFLPDEITLLNNWLDNGGEKGKSLIFVPGISVTSMPNLAEFLEEWGIKFSSGFLYQEDEHNYIQYPIMMYTYANETDITSKIVPDTEANYVLGNIVPMEKAFDAFEGRTPTVVMSTNDSATVMPEDADEYWTPDTNAEQKSYATLMVTEDLNVIDNNPHRSYVAAFSSYTMISSYLTKENLSAAVNTALYISGSDSESAVTFTPKTIESESFSDQVTAAKANLITVVFVIVIPIAIIVLGIVVFVKRRKR